MQIKEPEIPKKKELRRSQPRTKNFSLNFSEVGAYERASVNAALYQRLLIDNDPPEHGTLTTENNTDLSENLPNLSEETFFDPKKS